MAPGYVQAHMMSIKVVGRIIMMVLPPLARPGEGSGDVVFAEAPLPGMTAVPMAVFNHPISLQDPEEMSRWKNRMEDFGNAFLADVMTTGSCPYPSLHRVDFSLGTYRLPEPEGMTQVLKLDPASAFSRRFRMLQRNVIDRAMGSVDGISLNIVEPVWIAN